MQITQEICLPLDFVLPASVAAKWKAKNITLTQQSKATTDKGSEIYIF